MAGRILDLPCLLFDMTVGNNESWRDSWPYVDALGNPIPLLGFGAEYDFTLQSVATGALVVVASSGKSVGGLPLNGRVVAGGVKGNILGLNVDPAVMARIPVADGGYAHETQARLSGVRHTIARGFVTIRQGGAP